MADVRKSRRGVYYDLTGSPYEYKTPYGDLFKFSSEKKLEIYTRDVVKELRRVDDLIARHNLGEWLTGDIIGMLRRAVYRSFYKRVER